MFYFDSWRDVPEGVWRWPNFTPYEIRCRGTGAVLIVPHAMDSLQAMRDIVGPMKINSAYRSPIYNAKIGGAPLSRHKFGDAFDVSLGNYSKEFLHRAAIKAGFTGFGLTYNSFIHVDKGRARKW